LPSGWANASQLEELLRSWPSPHHSPPGEIRFQFPAGCHLMTDAIVRLLSLFNQLEYSTRRVILDFESDDSDLLGYPALMLALNAGMRNAEIRRLRWRQIDFEKRFLTVGRSKTEAGEGRTIPLNAALLEALQQHSQWYKGRFGRIDPEWYAFPFGRANHLDPSRPITTIKTAWANAKKRAGVAGRLHDSRHTLITELAESGAGDQTIMDIAGHVSRQMLKHYSHIRMEAKREALDAVWKKQQDAEERRKAEEANRAQECWPVSVVAQEIEGESLQKSLQSDVSGGRKHRKVTRKPLKRFGSSGRTRTLSYPLLSVSY
jgi:hypothetical protein